MPRKRVDLLIKRANLLKRRLVVVGTGPEEGRLKSLAGSTIEFLGYVPDARLSSLYGELPTSCLPQMKISVSRQLKPNLTVAR